MPDYVMPIAEYRAGLNPQQLAYDDASPMIEAWERVLESWDFFFKQRFRLITNDKVRGVFPEVSDLQAGERFGYYDFSGFVDDPGLESGGDNFKMFRARIVIEEGFDSLYKMQIGKTKIALELDDGIPRFKFAIPDGGGILHECVVEGDISHTTFVNMNKSENTWIAISDCQIAFRIEIQKDHHRLHDRPIHDCGTENPYDLREWNR